MHVISPVSGFDSKGYALFQMTDLDSLHFFDSLIFKSVEQNDEDSDESWIPEVIKTDLFEFAQILMNKIVTPHFPSVQFLATSMWDGVDQGSTVRHNDCLSPTGLNSSLLLYLDTPTNPESGSLFVKGKNFETRIHTSKGRLVWLNQTHFFLHRADKSPERRRVIGVDLFIPELSHLTSFYKAQEAHGSKT